MTEARVVAVLILTDAVEEVVTVSIQCPTSGIIDALHLGRSVSRSFIDGHNPKSTQDRIRPSHMSTNPLESWVNWVTLVLTPVFHGVHAMAILLVEKVHKLSVEETLSTITGVDRHDPHVLSLVLIPLSSWSCKSSRSIGILIIIRIISIRVSSSSTLIRCLVPSLVPNLLLSHQSL